MPRLAIEPTDEDRQIQAGVLSGLRRKRLEKAKASGDREEVKKWQATGTAARIGVSASNLSRYESGETMLPLPYLRPVAEVYGLRRSQLVRMLGLVDDEEQRFDRTAALREIARLAALLPAASISFADLGGNPDDWDDDDVRYIERRLRRAVDAQGSTDK